MVSEANGESGYQCSITPLVSVLAGLKQKHIAKWKTAIMYVTAISDYDRTLQEDNKTSRLYESLEVFEELCATPALKRAGFVVFFNKTGNRGVP